MEETANIVELDVRPYLRKKIEPFQVIMDAVKKLEPSDTFVLHATFKPTPLLGVMKTKGYSNQVEQRDNDHWVVTFIHKSRKDAFASDDAAKSAPSTASSSPKAGADKEPQVYKLDNRGLEPPKPMIRTLSKLEACRTGDKVVIHNDRVPVFLIEELNNLGYPFSVDEQADGSAKVTISKV
jgi:uncharacterized protein (DUF2249 family)